MATRKELETLYRVLGDELVMHAQRDIAAGTAPATLVTRAGALVPADVASLRDLARAHPEGMRSFLSAATHGEVAASDVGSLLEAIHATILDPTDLIDDFKSRPRPIPPLPGPGGASRLAAATPAPDPETPAGLFEGFDPAALPLRVEDTTFESQADWLAYAIRGGLEGARYHAGLLDCGPRPSTSSDYALGDYVRTIAVLSDLGTGLPHARYVAKQLERARYGCAFHLGNVAYAGSEREVRAHLEEPLAPAISNGTELFLLPGHLDMYAKGGPWLDYVRRKHDPATQRQDGAYFCVRAGKVQLIGADTAWSAHARLHDAAHLAWLEERLAAGRADSRMNILLTANPPYTYGEAGTTSLFTDLEPLVRRGLVDVWLWGNAHYGALFHRSDALPFVGAAVGHAGYPYRFDVDVRRSKRPGAPPDAWIERASRYRLLGDVRPDLGNNGFAELHLRDDGDVELVFVDWTGARRCRALVSRSNGRAEITALDAT